MAATYAAPPGGLPGQTTLLSDRAVFTEAYAVLPRGVLRDIVTSPLPGWRGTRAWVIARPLSGFAESFAQYVVEVAPEGGFDGPGSPEPDPMGQAALFAMQGAATLTIGGAAHRLVPGVFAYIPPGVAWHLRAHGEGPCVFHWIRKAWAPCPILSARGLGAPEPLVVQEAEVAPAPMPGTDGAWATTRFMDPADLRHDMHVTIVSMRPGAVIPFCETHVMEHGLYVLEGKAVYRLNRDWVEVEAGDFMWLRAFCPQAAYAGGPGPFRYLLYKDVNRHPALRIA